MKQKVSSPKFSPAEAQALYDKAHAAGMKAGQEIVPVPMHVVQRAHPFDDSSPIIKRYAPVMDGPCGFAWVKIMPGNSSFARWVSKRGYGSSSYSGGVDIWVSHFNQSVMRKEAYASAFAGVLKEAGIMAFGQSRLD